MIPPASPPIDFHCGLDDVHFWICSLDLPSSVLNRFRAVLSLAELQRACTFRFAEHRDRFIAGRGIMRTLLGQYLRADPAKVEFAYGPSGKPFLCGRFRESELKFNLAHSENLAVFAITCGRAIGVDIERIRPVTGLDELVARYFSAREMTLFYGLPSEQKLVAFFNLWTRKEAWLKATGEGIGRLLNQVEVSFMPGEPARLLTLPWNPKPLPRGVCTTS